MALYAIGDLHLSLGPADKPMDVFGGRREGYVDKLRENLRVIGPEDTTVLLGDLSWAMSLEDAAEDFTFMNAIPGRKIILKGNHDYWWTTLKAFDRFCAEHGFLDFHVLNNSCFFYGSLRSAARAAGSMTNRRPAATTRRSSGASSGGWSGRCSWRERRKNTASCTTRRATGAMSARRSWLCSRPTA